jgi:hypothetical protein
MKMIPDVEMTSMGDAPPEVRGTPLEERGLPECAGGDAPPEVRGLSECDAGDAPPGARGSVKGHAGDAPPRARETEQSGHQGRAAPGARERVLRVWVRAWTALEEAALARLGPLEVPRPGRRPR